MDLRLFMLSRMYFFVTCRRMFFFTIPIVVHLLMLIFSSHTPTYICKHQPSHPRPAATDLQAGDVGAEEGRELAGAAGALALVTHLVIQHVRLHLHLRDTASRASSHAARRADHGPTRRRQTTGHGTLTPGLPGRRGVTDGECAAPLTAWAERSYRWRERGATDCPGGEELQMERARRH